MAPIVFPLTLTALLILAGCATPDAYDPVQDTGFPSPELTQVRAEPQTYEGMKVRWGGRIARVENRRDATLIEIVQQELAGNGRPRKSSDSQGRFLARIPGFLDPVIYAQGRELTVTGSLQPPVQRNIGEYPYTFPVVAVERYQLWPPRPEREVILYPRYELFYWNSIHAYPWYRRHFYP